MSILGCPRNEERLKQLREVQTMASTIHDYNLVESRFFKKYNQFFLNQDGVYSCSLDMIVTLWKAVVDHLRTVISVLNKMNDVIDKEARIFDRVDEEIQRLLVEEAREVTAWFQQNREIFHQEIQRIRSAIERLMGHPNYEDRNHGCLDKYIKTIDEFELKLSDSIKEAADVYSHWQRVDEDIQQQSEPPIPPPNDSIIDRALNVIVPIIVSFGRAVWQCCCGGR